MNQKAFAIVGLAVLLASCIGQEKSAEERTALTWEDTASSHEKGLDWEKAVDAWENAAKAWEKAGDTQRATNARMKAALNWEVAALTYEKKRSGTKQWKHGRTLQRSGNSSGMQKKRY